MTDKCCEDVYGNSLCQHEIGTFCDIKYLTGGNYIRLTRDGVDLLRQIGCPFFLERETRAIEPPQDRCDTCLSGNSCNFRSDMAGKDCSKYMFNGGVLSERNWT